MRRGLIWRRRSGGPAWRLRPGLTVSSLSVLVGRPHDRIRCCTTQSVRVAMGFQSAMFRSVGTSHTTPPSQPSMPFAPDDDPSSAMPASSTVFSTSFSVFSSIGVSPLLHVPRVSQVPSFRDRGVAPALQNIQRAGNNFHDHWTYYIKLTCGPKLPSHSASHFSVSSPTSCSPSTPLALAMPATSRTPSKPHLT